MPKTILLADDSVTIQKVVGISFANEDVVLLTVDNGDDAVLQARESRPDIVLADIVMPGKSGYEVCEALRGDPELRNIPVLLLSGTFETFDEDRAREVGANGHITKPFEAQSLVDRVNELLEGGGAEEQAAAEAPDLTLGTSFSDPSSSQSGSEAYDFFDEEMPAIPGESPRLAETKLIGSDPSADSMSGQVFDLDPMEERSAGGAEPALEAAEEPSLGAPVGPAHELTPPETDTGFGSSFAPEEPVASSSAFSFEENPDLAEAVEAFGQPDRFDPSEGSDLDPLTSPVAMPESGPDEAELGAPDIDAVPDDLLAQGVGQSFEATEVHAPEPGPAAGDDLYEDFGGPEENEFFAEEADDAVPFAETEVPAALGREAAEGPEAPAPAISPPAPAEAAPAHTHTHTHTGWDEDPESLSQSALEPLPETEEADDALAHPVATVSDEPFASAPEVATSIPVEAPLAPEPAAAAPPASGAAAPIPAELQERMHATLERIAWEAMGDLSERVIKETLGRIESIAWEVIPQMAETMIREELNRIAGEDEPE